MIRIIIKETHQPPIDTPAQISYRTVDIESEELENILNKRDSYTHYQVIGAEIKQ